MKHFTGKIPSFLSTSDLLMQVELLEKLKLDSGFGWKRYRSTYRSLAAYRNESMGIVIKKQNCILEPRTPLSVRVSTEHLRDGWVMQPIVKKVNLKMACENIRRRIAGVYKKGIFPDLHTGNVGWYDGKPVMFDW